MPSLKLISATDTEYSTAVLKSLNEQRNDGLFCDITIIIRDKKFRAHKTILAASSKYFHQLFTVAGQVIELNFIRAEIFEEILNYIYTSKIVRVRSDRLEELIHAGKILGVKFIANLASPLSHVKGLPGLSKKAENKTDSNSEVMPIITESFSISSEEFHQTSKPEGNDEDSDSDVMFVSQTTNQKVDSEVIDLESTENSTITDVQQEDAGSQKTYSVKPPHSGTISSPNSNSNNVSAPECATESPSPSTSFSHGPSNSTLSPPNNNNLGVHKKQVSTPEPHEGDPKIRLLDVSPVSGIPSQSNVSASKLGAEQTVTLKTAAEIGSISPDCRVYANIGEDTYDIVTTKDDPEEGGSTGLNGKRAYMATLTKAIEDPPTPLTSGPKSKKAKVDENQYYELVMDGKTFYVCVVCKRPYVCLTSVRRHYNTHSWEKQYPCRHCNKVFALAEYRTKHEISHTGERRYQCLLCQEMFLNYQVLSSHIRSVHNQDASGKKAKDETDDNLYRLLPCKSVKMKMYSWVTDEKPSDIKSVMTDDGSVHIKTSNQQDSTQRSMLNWDDIFIEPDASSQPGSSVNNSSKREPEFDFLIPETY